jgi:glycosyltransferase involved in cell wall biosynthesis
MESPAVSVILVVRDGAATLPLALRSIAAQTESRWELLAYDDGSRDETPEILERWASADPRIRLFRSPESRGLGARLNELVAAARGPLIARMDADDVSYPDRLRRQVEFLAARPEVDLVGASLAVFHDDGVLLGKRTAPPSHAKIVGVPFRAFRIFHPTWMGRAEWFRRHPYKGGAVRSQDQELLYRALPRSTYANLSEILLGYREERISLTRNSRARWQMTWRVAVMSIRRGRPDHAVLNALSHLVKAALDVIAVATGAGHRLLRQRAGRISPEEREEWNRVWRSVRDAPGMPLEGVSLSR